MEWIKANFIDIDGETEIALVLTDGTKAYASMRLKQTNDQIAKTTLALISFQYDFNKELSKPILA